MVTHAPSSIRLITLGFGRASADLAAVIATLMATAFAVLLNGPVIVRAPLAFLVVFLVPGYTLSITLFPVGESTLDGDPSPVGAEPRLSLLARGVLSVGLSLSLAVVVGLVIDLLPIALATEIFLGAVVAVTGLTTITAYLRRSRAPPVDRYAPFSARDQQTGAGRFGGLDVLSVVLVLSVVFSGGAMAYSAGVAGDQTDVTAFYFLTESADGDFVAGEYPTNLTVGNETELTLAIENRRGERTDYAVVGQLQRVAGDRRGPVVQSNQQVYADRVTVGVGEEETLEAAVAPHSDGRYRLTFLLYRGDPPDRPRIANAHREIHLWVRVSDSGSATSSGGVNG